MERLASDDEAAFTELYNRFWQKLFAVAYNRLKEMQTAEDVVHDVFVALWTNRHRLSVESLENYLATATKYLVLAKIKQKVRDRAYAGSLAAAPCAEASAETALHYKRILELVHQEVEKLPEKCRLVFQCSRQQHMPVKEVAHHLQISPKTVENQLTKALKQLRPVLRSFFHF